MINKDDTILYLGSAAILTALISIVNVIFFQIKYQTIVDKKIHGDNYIDGGWLFNSTRMLMYAHYCLFPARAKKDSVNQQISALSLKVKMHLVFNWITTLSAVTLAVLAGTLIKWHS